MKSIRRIREGQKLPKFGSVERILSVEEELWPAGTTSSRRVYTAVVSDDRYWLSDEEKSKHDLFGYRYA